MAVISDNYVAVISDIYVAVIFQTFLSSTHTEASLPGWPDKRDAQNAIINTYRITASAIFSAFKGLIRFCLLL